MDRNLRTSFSFRPLAARISARLPSSALRRVREAFSLKHFPTWVRPLFLLALSALLAFRAYDSTERAAAEEWMRTHAPSPVAWTALLDRFGYRAVEDPALLDKWTRTLPLRVPRPWEVWVSDSLDRVVLLRPDSEFEPIALYVRKEIPLKPSRVPQAWRTTGLGWAGFEGLTELLGQMPRPVPRRLQPQSHLDSRQLNY
jgi:hypothetical protein